MILLDAVTRTFGDVRALDDVSLAMRRGEVLGLLGHNGAGKTTAVRLVAGLLAPNTGRVRVDGLDPVADGIAVRRRLGVLPAAAAVDGRMTVRDNLGFAGDLYGLPRVGLADRIDAVLGRMQLAGRVDERAAGLSTGMRQRLSIARVLLHDPDVLLLDEPTASLDPVAARRVRDLIDDLRTRDDRTVMLCTHDLAEAQRLCDRVAILEHGRIIALGTPTDLAGSEATSVDVQVHPDDLELAGSVDAIAGVRGHPDDDRHVRFPGVAKAEIPRLVHALSSAGVRVYGVDRHAPSLEEVYLRLHERDQEVLT